LVLRGIDAQMVGGGKATWTANFGGNEYAERIVDFTVTPGHRTIVWPYTVLAWAAPAGGWVLRGGAEDGPSPHLYQECPQVTITEARRGVDKPPIEDIDDTFPRVVESITVPRVRTFEGVWLVGVKISTRTRGARTLWTVSRIYRWDAIRFWTARYARSTQDWYFVPPAVGPDGPIPSPITPGESGNSEGSV
jgi:hypothetical protein